MGGGRGVRGGGGRSSAGRWGAAGRAREQGLWFVLVCHEAGAVVCGGACALGIGPWGAGRRVCAGEFGPSFVVGCPSWDLGAVVSGWMCVSGNGAAACIGTYVWGGRSCGLQWDVLRDRGCGLQWDVSTSGRELWLGMGCLCCGLRAVMCFGACRLESRGFGCSGSLFWGIRAEICSELNVPGDRCCGLQQHVHAGK